MSKLEPKTKGVKIWFWLLMEYFLKNKKNKKKNRKKIWKKQKQRFLNMYMDMTILIAFVYSAGFMTSFQKIELKKYSWICDQ